MASNRKSTSSNVASLAAKTVFSSGSSKIARQLAGSALSQSGTNRQTSAELERKASKVLRGDHYAADTKTLAASVLAQSNKGR